MELVPDIGGIDLHLDPIHVRGLKGNILEEPFHDGVEPSSSDVFGRVVHRAGNTGNFLDCIRGKAQIYALGRQEGGVLLDEGVLGLGQDPDKVLLGEAVQFYPQGKTTLHLWDQVRRLRDVEGPSRDEEDMVGPDHPVLCTDRRPLHDWQKISLYPFPGDVRTVCSLPPRDLVDLVQEDDPGVLRPPNCFGEHLIHVNQFLGLFLSQDSSRLHDLDSSTFHTVWEEVVEHVPQLIHPLYPCPRDNLDHGQRPVPDLNLHHSIIQLPLPHHSAEFFPGFLGGSLGCLKPNRLRTCPAWGDEEIKESLLGQLGRPLSHRSRPLTLNHVDRNVGQIPDDGVHIPSHIANLGELGRFDLQEGGLGQLGQSPGNLGLPNAGGTDHDDVLGRHLVPEFRRQLLPPPPIAYRDGDRLLCRVLADDVSIQLGHNLSGCQLFHRTVPFPTVPPGCSELLDSDLVITIHGQLGRDLHRLPHDVFQVEIGKFHQRPCSRCRIGTT